MISNKKGFTLIELLATIVILGLLVTLGYVSVRAILDRGNDNYYKTQEDMLILAGKDYFADYRSKLPKEVGKSAYVTLKTLIDEKYIDPIKDENEKDCNVDESRVTALKVSETEYQYYGSLVCDDYKTTTDETDPVIKFTPNKKSSQENITVKMEITDNKKVSQYRYVITKNGETYQDSGYKDYTGEVTINLKEIGLYQITGYAKDDSNNTSSKKSGKYSIYDTVNCEQITISSDFKANTWYNKDITLNISAPKNTYKYEVSIKKNEGDYKLVNTYIGSPSSSVVLNEDGTYTIKVVAYDNNGKSCGTTSGTYKIDKTAPSNITISGNPGCVTQPATISPTLKATETGSGIAKWQYGYSTNSMIDYANSGSNTFTTTPFSAVRNQPAYFRACDKVGNCSDFASTNICIIRKSASIGGNAGNWVAIYKPRGNDGYAACFGNVCGNVIGKLDISWSGDYGNTTSWFGVGPVSWIGSGYYVNLVVYKNGSYYASYSLKDLNASWGYNHWTQGIPVNGIYMPTGTYDFYFQSNATNPNFNAYMANVVVS